jgi:hypothetical protein
MRSSLAWLALLAGCGGDDDGILPVVDAGSDAPACTPATIFINALAGGPATYRPGADDSRADTMFVLEQPATVGPMADDRAAEVIALLASVYGQFGVVFTEQDPSPATHIEIVLVGSDWPLEPNVAVTAPRLECGVINRNSVTMVNGAFGSDDVDLAGFAMFAINAMAGLPPVDVAGNCGTPIERPPECTFANDVPSNGICGPTADQLDLLHANLGCAP